MAAGTVHVVGAGLAGLTAAIRLTEAGRRVILHEAQAHAGGRCRSFHDARLGREIDNGNHLVLSGNAAVARLLATTGAAGRLVAEPEAGFAFADLATGQRWRVSLNAGPLPWWIAAPGRRIPDTRAGDYLGAARLGLAGPGATVAQAIGARGAIWTRFWEPLTRAAINTVPERASARLLWRVLRETFLRGAAHARPMLAPGGLGAALVAPAVEWLSARGAAPRFGRMLRAVEREEGRAAVLRFSDGEERLGPGDRVVLALPPSRLRAVLPEADPPEDACAILNAFFVLPGAGAAIAARQPPILGLLGATTHWIFRRGDVASLTVSASDALGLDREDPATLLPRLWDETRRALGLPDEMQYVAARLNKERRATFDQSPAGEARRPGARTALANLWLAGDATDTGLPATIEGAIRSGETAARLAA